MGCDIHLYAEKRQCNAEGALLDTWEPIGGRNELYRGGRHYKLFGVLSGVRWSPPFDPIALASGETFGPYVETNGLPADVSAFVRGELQDDADIHSRSHATLAELDAFNWAQEIEQSFNVLGSDAVNFRNYGWSFAPTEIWEYRDGVEKTVFGKVTDITWVDSDEMDRRVDAYVKRMRELEGGYERGNSYNPAEIDAARATFGNVGCREWEVKIPLFTKFQNFLGATLPALRAHAAGDSTSVRLVWGFDN